MSKGCYLAQLGRGCENGLRATMRYTKLRTVYADLGNALRTY